MKINKKGFTLVELLAVVVIMLAISVMAVSSISAAMERSRNKQDESKKKVLENYAEIYYEEHKNTFIDGCISLDNCCISINNLREADLVNGEEIKDSKGNLFNGTICHESGNWEYKENNN